MWGFTFIKYVYKPQQDMKEWLILVCHYLGATGVVIPWFIVVCKIKKLFVESPKKQVPSPNIHH